MMQFVWVAQKNDSKTRSQSLSSASDWSTLFKVAKSKVQTQRSSTASQHRSGLMKPKVRGWRYKTSSERQQCAQWKTRREEEERLQSGEGFHTREVNLVHLGALTCRRGLRSGRADLLRLLADRWKAVWGNDASEWRSAGAATAACVTSLGVVNDWRTTGRRSQSEGSNVTIATLRSSGRSFTHAHTQS